MELSTVLNIDKKVRSALLIGRFGEIKEQKARNEPDPIISPEELRELALELAVRPGLAKGWGVRFGELRCGVVILQKLAVFAFLLEQDALIIAAEPDISLSVIDRVAATLDGKSAY